MIIKDIKNIIHKSGLPVGPKALAKVGYNMTTKTFKTLNQKELSEKLSEQIQRQIEFAICVKQKEELNQAKGMNSYAFLSGIISLTQFKKNSKIIRKQSAIFIQNLWL